MNDAEYREQHVTGAARVVVKIGSGVLTKDGGLNVNRLGRICAQIHNLRLQNREIVLVSSGAIASGFKKIGLKEKPKGVRKFQACAAVGQAGLIMAYEKSLERRGHKVAQVLLTASDLFHRRRYINAKNTLTMLLEWSVIPIINENDTVAVDEIKFGDNDTLGGLVTGLVGADLFINLTDIQGLYDRDPRQNKNARFMSVIQPDTEGLDKVASRIPGALGAGGMYTKVVAARRLSRQGVPSVIASGNIPRVLERILDGQPIGTLFLPKAERLSQRKHWIAMTASPGRAVIVDDGARRALVERGKSLLPIGVIKTKGRFGRGDSIQVLDRSGQMIAAGLTNYASEEIAKITGCRSDDLETNLGCQPPSAEVIHRDNMVVGDDLKV